MDMMTAKAKTEQIGLTWKGDFIDALSDDERNAGYIKFNIPNPETPHYLCGEGVWGWATPEDKQKCDDENFRGKLSVVLCSDPLYYSGTLFAGQEVVIRCNGEIRPILDPHWVQEHLTSAAKDIEEIAATATLLLKNFTDDYAGRIWKKIKEARRNAEGVLGGKPGL